MSKAGVLKPSHRKAVPPATPTTHNGTALMTSTMKIRDELLTCRLCSLRFRLYDKRPLALRCMHTFCEECLIARLQATDGERSKIRLLKKTSHQLSCPVCDVKTPIGKEIQECRALPVNPSIMELLQILELSPSSAGKGAASDHRFSTGPQITVANSAPHHSQQQPAAQQQKQQQQQQQQQQLQQQQQQQSGSNSVTVVNGRVATNGLQRHVANPPDPPMTCVHTGSLANVANDRVHENSSPSTFDAQEMIGSSQNLVTMVSIGTAGALKPANCAAASEQPQYPPRLNGGVKALPTAAPASTVTQTSTSVHVGSQSAVANHFAADDILTVPTSDVPPIVVMCSKCRTNPASVTVASASKMTSLQLCSGCAKPKSTVVQQSSSWNTSSDMKTQSSADEGTVSASADDEQSGRKADDKKKTEVTLPASSDLNSHHHSQQGPSQVFVGGGKKPPVKPLKSAGSGSPQSAGAALRNVVEPADSGRSEEARERDHPQDALRSSQPRSETLQAQCNQSPDAPRIAAQITPSGAQTAAINGISGGGGARDTAARTCQRNNENNERSAGRERDHAVGCAATSKETEAMMYEQSNRLSLHFAGERPMPASNAPAIDEIYPPPCDNPPFNPDYRTLNGGIGAAATWLPTDSSPPYEEYQGSMASIHVPDLPPPQFPDRVPIALHGQRTALPGQSVELAFAVPTCPSFPAQPPKYEEVMMNGGIPPPVQRAAQPQSNYYMSNGMTSSGGYSSSGARSSPGTRLLRTFGKYSDISTQPAAFRKPTRISTSQGQDSIDGGGGGGRAKDAERLRVVVTDRANATVQVFTAIGECLSMLRVDEVEGCCLWNHNSCLVTATDHGVEVYDINGSRLDIVSLGPVLNVVRYINGFIAVQSKSLSIFKGPSAVLTSTLTSKTKPGQRGRVTLFDNIHDVAVNSQQDLIVLESTAGGDAVVSIMTEDGFIKSTVTPSQSDPCGLLKSPVAVAVDDAHNVFIVATGLDGIKRIVMFGANGRFQREIIGPNAAERGLIGSEASRRTTVWPAGVATGVNGQLYAVMRGDRIAEIRLIEYA